MRVLTVPDPACPDPTILREATQVLCRGGVIGFPTDTVYGIGTLPAYEEHLFTAKERPAAKQIPWLIAGIEQAPCPLSALARDLAERYWPGPLTLVVPMGEGTIGLRAPDHALVQAILRAVGMPLAVTSANRSGEPPAREAAAAVRMLDDRVDLVLDAGPSGGCEASTVVRVSDSAIELLREGAISFAELSS